MDVMQRCWFMDFKIRMIMKKKELILKRPQDFKLHKTSDPKVLLFKYLVKPLYRTWMEDYTDEDTGEVVSIERSELVAGVGQIGQNELQQITFALQAGDIKEVEYCCHDLGDVQILEAGRTFLVEYLVNFDERKRCLVFAKGIGQAMQIIADYNSVNCGSFERMEFVSIKSVVAVFIPDNDKCIPADEQEGFDKLKDYYKVNVKFISFDEEYSRDYIITADEVGKAKSRVERYIKNNFAKENEEPHFNVRKAMPFEVDYVVPVEYCKMYWGDKK